VLPSRNTPAKAPTLTTRREIRNTIYSVGTVRRVNPFECLAQFGNLSSGHLVGYQDGSAQHMTMQVFAAGNNSNRRIQTTQTLPS
jgi:hypothetical protein